MCFPLVDSVILVGGRGDPLSPLCILTDRHTPEMAAIRRSRLRIAVGTMNHRSRLPLSARVASRTPSFSRSTIRAWMVPLWRRGSRPMARTRSEQVWGPFWIRWERTEARMMEESIGLRWWCGVVPLECILVGQEGQERPPLCILINRHSLHFVSVAVAVAGSKEPCLVGADLSREGLLRGKLGFAGNPAEFAGFQIGAGGEDCHCGVLWLTSLS